LDPAFNTPKKHLHSEETFSRFCSAPVMTWGAALETLIVLDEALTFHPQNPHWTEGEFSDLMCLSEIFLVLTVSELHIHYIDLYVLKWVFMFVFQIIFAIFAYDFISLIRTDVLEYGGW